MIFVAFSSSAVYLSMCFFSVNAHLYFQQFNSWACWYVLYSVYMLPSVSLCVCLFVEYDNVLWFLVVFVRSFIQIYFLFVHLSFSRCSSVSCVLCVRTFPQSITLALSKWNELEKCLPHSDGCYLIFLFRCSPFVAIKWKVFTILNRELPLKPRYMHAI